MSSAKPNTQRTRNLERPPKTTTSQSRERGTAYQSGPGKEWCRVKGPDSAVQEEMRTTSDGGSRRAAGSTGGYWEEWGRKEGEQKDRQS